MAIPFPQPFDLVYQGIGALLPKVDPQEWWELHNAAEHGILDMASHDRCILGLLYGDFWKGLDALIALETNPDSQAVWAASHGFMISPYLRMGEVRYYDDITTPQRSAVWANEASLRQCWLVALDSFVPAMMEMYR